MGVIAREGLAGPQFTHGYDNDKDTKVCFLVTYVIYMSDVMLKQVLRYSTILYQSVCLWGATRFVWIG